MASRVNYCRSSISRLILLWFVGATAAQAQTRAPVSYDRGAAGVWQKLQKLTTNASLMHTTAHPDDEHEAC